MSYREAIDILQSVEFIAPDMDTKVEEALYMACEALRKQAESEIVFKHV